MKNYILKIDCPDEKGLVHKISGVLYHNGFNMVRNSEYVDNESNHFFMRTDAIGSGNPKEIIKEMRLVLHPAAKITFQPQKQKPIVILVTKEYHCLGDLLLRNYFNELSANIRAVISNYDHLEKLAEKFSIPYHHISHLGIERQLHEDTIAQVIGQYSPDYIILAKYMRIFSEGFVRKFPDKIINIHHSFLPAFIGAKPYYQAYERGVKMIGATAHFINNNLDEGPIITQDVVYVNHKLNARDMAKAGMDVEKIVLAKALKLVFDDMVFIHNNKTVILD